jgi:hypothetical protein
MQTLLSMKTILAMVTYKDYVFEVSQDGDGFLVKAAFPGVCSVTNKPSPQHTRKWKVSKHATKSEVVGTLMKLVLTSEEHEARENFRYLGRAVFGPHFDVDTLVEMSRKAASYDYRPPAPETQG